MEVLVVQAVVRYMADVVAKRETKPQLRKQKKSWAQMWFFSRSNKRVEFTKA